MINFSTGPVEILPQVVDKLNSPIVSHRSADFKKLHKNLTTTLCNQLNVQETFILTGSGTMANDAMLYHIKSLKSKGLILVNGEFGKRLKVQAGRIGLVFGTLEREWGMAFSSKVISEEIRRTGAQWLLACHCETSTGQTLSIDELGLIAKEHKVSLFLDCMSSFGIMPINLKSVAMATASTAKGVGSLPGLAMVFSNSTIIHTEETPIYLDLFHAQKCGGIPFTISSNLIAGLLAAVEINNVTTRWNQLKIQAGRLFESFDSLSLLPFSCKDALVFTLVFHKASAVELARKLAALNIKVAYESDYLKPRNWMQVALFSNYTEKEISYFIEVFMDLMGSTNEIAIESESSYIRSNIKIA